MQSKAHGKAGKLNIGTIPKLPKTRSATQPTVYKIEEAMRMLTSASENLKLVQHF